MSEEPQDNVGDYRGTADEYPLKDGKGVSKIERQAIKQRWNIPDKYKDGVINRQVQIAVNPETPNREATSAAKAIIQAVGQNQKDEHELLKRFTEHRIAELDQVAIELGLEESIVEGIARESEDDS